MILPEELPDIARGCSVLGAGGGGRHHDGRGTQQPESARVKGTNYAADLRFRKSAGSSERRNQALPARVPGRPRCSQFRRSYSEQIGVLVEQTPSSRQNFTAAVSMQFGSAGSQRLQDRKSVV